MQKIILASASPRRAELLRQLGIEFCVTESGVAEEQIGETAPAKLAERLALAKAEAVAGRIEEGLIIAADTVVFAGEKLLGKPASPADARAMLRQLSGSRHEVMTGIALIALPVKTVRTHVETTAVYMREISEQEMDWYISSREPFDKAGGYGIQGKAAVFVERLEGCYFNVVGLPLAALWRLLADLGIDVWEGAGMNDNTAPNHQGFATK